RRGGPAIADANHSQDVGEESQCRLGELWAAHILVENWRELDALRRHRCVARVGGAPDHGLELRPRARCGRSGKVVPNRETHPESLPERGTDRARPWANSPPGRGRGWVNGRDPWQPN